MITRQKKVLAIVVTLAAALSIAAATLALPEYSHDSSTPAVEARATSELSPAVTDADKATGTNKAIDAKAEVAAKQNVLLRDGLDWTFGGKPQRGWSIYESLIAHTLDVQAGAGSADFAQAVARWQKFAHLPSTGVLDRADWMQMIAGWQSHRLKGAAYPDAAQLLSIPSSELYDPNRPADMRLVARETYAAYKRLLAAAISDRSLGLKTKSNGELADAEKFLKVVSAFRSKEHQERLRREQPEVGRAALATNSPHFTGRALDLYVGGYDPVSTKDDNRALQTQTKAYKWLVQNAERFGFRPYFFEPWHWEYVGK
jgi:D-alanyl-D-alanine carboxypeptidase